MTPGIQVRALADSKDKLNSQTFSVLVCSYTSGVESHIVHGIIFKNNLLTISYLSYLSLGILYSSTIKLTTLALGNTVY